MIFRDKYGCPVERFCKRPVVNLIRLILHTDIGRTWRDRNRPISETCINQQGMGETSAAKGGRVMSKTPKCCFIPAAAAVEACQKEDQR